MSSLTTIGLDADDTLWHNERYFHFTEQRFREMLADHGAPDDISAKLLATERKNLQFYGFGIKGYTLSLIETALDVTDGKISSKAISQILDYGREMLHAPVELMPSARETIEALRDDYRLVLITKGDLFDQERKVAQSGLGDYFHGVEIVSDKSPETYTRIFNHYGTGPDAALMAGNSLKSDVIPALTAGAHGVHIPHDLTWAHEHAEAPKEHPRFREVKDLGGLVDVVHKIS